MPIQPATSVLAYLLVADLLCQLSGGTTPHTGLTIEDELLIGGRLREAKFVLKLVGGHEQRIWRGADWDVDGVWNVACFVFGRLADV